VFVVLWQFSCTASLSSGSANDTRGQELNLRHSFAQGTLAHVLKRVVFKCSLHSLQTTHSLSDSLPLMVHRAAFECPAFSCPVFSASPTAFQWESTTGARQFGPAPLSVCLMASLSLPAEGVRKGCLTVSVAVVLIARWLSVGDYRKVRRLSMGGDLGGNSRGSPPPNN